MPRANAPVSSFGPELQAALRKGAGGAYTIDFETEALAARFAQRINSLRKAMRAENHADWQQLYRVGVYCKKSQVTISPRDSEFASALSSAGVDNLLTSFKPKAEPTASTEESSSSPDPADSFLSNLKGEE